VALDDPIPFRELAHNSSPSNMGRGTMRSMGEG
jgi:hypothetical protein